MALDLHQKICFRSISWEQFDRISSNFIHALILTRSSLGLLHIIFTLLYQSYGPWLTPKFCFRSIYWEQIDRISPNFIYAFICTRSSLGLLNIISRTFLLELWPLINAKNLFPLNILRTNWRNFAKFLYMHSYWQDLALNCYASFFTHMYQSYVPWFSPKFVSVQYRENKWTEFHQIFKYAIILTRSTSGLLHYIFCLFVPELWPLIYSKISFRLNILRTNEQFFTKLYITIYTDKIYVGIVSCHFSQICKRVMALD